MIHYHVNRSIKFFNEAGKSDHIVDDNETFSEKIGQQLY